MQILWKYISLRILYAKEWRVKLEQQAKYAYMSYIMMAYIDLTIVVKPLAYKYLIYPLRVISGSRCTVICRRHAHDWTPLFVHDRTERHTETYKAFFHVHSTRRLHTMYLAHPTAASSSFNHHEWSQHNSEERKKMGFACGPCSHPLKWKMKCQTARRILFSHEICKTSIRRFIENGKQKIVNYYLFAVFIHSFIPIDTRRCCLEIFSMREARSTSIRVHSTVVELLNRQNWWWHCITHRLDPSRQTFKYTRSLEA